MSRDIIKYRGKEIRYDVDGFYIKYTPHENTLFLEEINLQGEYERRYAKQGLQYEYTNRNGTNEKPYYQWVIPTKRLENGNRFIPLYLFELLLKGPFLFPELSHIWSRVLDRAEQRFGFNPIMFEDVI